jgi:hypothetical protein
MLIGLEQKNYYYLDPQSKLMLIKKLMSDIEKLLVSQKCEK